MERTKVKDKRGSVPAVMILIPALVILIGSQSFLSPCVHADGSFGSCHWAGQMMLGIGGLLFLQALLTCLLRERGLYLAMVPTAVLGALTPGTLISLCKMNTMRCRMIMQPAMIILCAVILVLALAGWIMERKNA